MNVLQNQFQSLLDMKDTELNDLCYGIKTKSMKKEQEVDLKHQLNTLEQNIQSKSLEMRWLETDSEENEVSSFIYLNYT